MNDLLLSWGNFIVERTSWCYLLSIMNIQDFKLKSEFWKNCIWNDKPVSFPALQKLSDKIDGGLSECEFLILIKNVSIFRRSLWITHWI